MPTLTVCFDDVSRQNYVNRYIQLLTSLLVLRSLPEN